MAIERAWVLYLIPVIIFLFYLSRGKSFFLFPSLQNVPRDNLAQVMRGCYKMASWMLFALLLWRAAGIQLPQKEIIKYGYGADIVFLLDLSYSMENQLMGDYHPAFDDSSYDEQSDKPKAQKFDVAVDVLKNFAKLRKEGRDRYGLTVFSDAAARVLPLTFNNDAFLSVLEQRQIGELGGGTVIFRPLLAAVNEMKHSGAQVKIIVLVSDGEGAVQDKLWNLSDSIVENDIRVYWFYISSQTGISANYGETGRLIQKIGSYGKIVNVSTPSELKAGFSELAGFERSVIVYKEDEPIISDNLLLYALSGLVIFVWIILSFSVLKISPKKRWEEKK